MTRFAALALLCLACGGNSPELIDDGDDDSGGSAGMPGAGGSAGSGVVTGGDGGTGAAEAGGASGMASGGAQATGGAFTGGTGTGGVFPMGGTSTGGTVATGGAAPTGGSGAVPQGGVGPTGGSGGSAAGGSGGAAGRLLWSQEFIYTGTTTAGAAAEHSLRIYTSYPGQVCMTIGDSVAHGTTGETTIGVGTLLGTCLGTTNNPDHRHEFSVQARGTGGLLVSGGRAFQLPTESEMWRPRTVVRRIAQNDWMTGSVMVRETWEFRE